MADTVEGLVKRLQPKHTADEPIARAVVSNDMMERRETVSAFLVANNALKAEAASALEALEARALAAEAQRDKLREALKPFLGDATMEGLLWDGLPDDATGTVTIRLGAIRKARSAIDATGTGELPQDVIDLVIEARNVAYSDQSQEAIDALDKAVEAFAERVEWDDDPANCEIGGSP